MTRTKSISLLRGGWMAMAVVLLAAACAVADARRGGVGWREQPSTAPESGVDLPSGVLPRVFAFTPANPADRLAEAYRLLELAETMTRSANGPGSRTNALLASARLALRDAGRELAAGRVDEGEVLMRRSRQAIRESTAKRIRASRTPAFLADSVAAVEALGGEALNLASTCDDPAVKRLGERAAEHLRLARDHLGARRLDEAAAEAAVARSLYRRMSDLCAR